MGIHICDLPADLDPGELSTIRGGVFGFEPQPLLAVPNALRPEADNSHTSAFDLA